MSSDKHEIIQDHLVTILEQNKQFEQSGTVVHTDIDSEPIYIQIAEQFLYQKKRLIDCLSPDIVDLTVVEQSTTIELEGYITMEGYITKPAHNLHWWKVNHARFPNIAKAARRYLCIPATEVPA